MRMRKRIGLFVIVFFGTGLPVGAIALQYEMLWVFLFWFAMVGIAQFYVFRCPHCAKVAVFTPSWGGTPFVGSRCRFCGKEYLSYAQRDIAL